MERMISFGWMEGKVGLVSEGDFVAPAGGSESSAPVSPLSCVWRRYNVLSSDCLFLTDCQDIALLLSLA